MYYFYEGDSVVSSKKFKKCFKVISYRGIMNDDLIISFIKDYPLLYNTRLKDFKNKAKREHAWNHIAISLGYNVHDVKRRWKVLRDRFVRRLKRNDYDNVFSKLPHYSQLSFLIDMVSHRKTKRRCSSSSVGTSEEITKKQLEDEDIINKNTNYSQFIDESDSVSDFEPSQIGQKDNSKHNVLLPKIISDPKAVPVSDDVHYLLSLRSSFSKITDERKKIYLKGEILNLVQDYLE